MHRNWVTREDKGEPLALAALMTRFASNPQPPVTIRQEVLRASGKP